MAKRSQKTFWIQLEVSGVKQTSLLDTPLEGPMQPPKYVTGMWCPPRFHYLLISLSQKGPETDSSNLYISLHNAQVVAQCTINVWKPVPQDVVVAARLGGFKG